MVSASTGAVVVSSCTGASETASGEFLTVVPLFILPLPRGTPTRECAPSVSALTVAPKLVRDIGRAAALVGTRHARFCAATILEEGTRPPRVAPRARTIISEGAKLVPPILFVLPYPSLPKVPHPATTLPARRPKAPTGLTTRVECACTLRYARDSRVQGELPARL